MQTLSRGAAVRLLRRTGCGALALDVSATRVGVAVTDPARTQALPLATLRRGRLDATGAATRAVGAALRPLVAEHGVGLLVVGWPLEVSGREGRRCREVAGFVADLATFGALALPATLVDERFSTRAARAALEEAGAPPRVVDRAEDRVSASIVLDALLADLLHRPPPARHGRDFFGDGA